MNITVILLDWLYKPLVKKEMWYVKKLNFLDLIGIAVPHTTSASYVFNIHFHFFLTELRFFGGFTIYPAIHNTKNAHFSSLFCS